MEFQETPLDKIGFEPGMRIKNYVIIKEINRGGMGIIYLAQHMESREYVAIKIVLKLGTDNNERLLKRFLQESEICSKLKHPNIIKIYEAGVHNNIPYMIMEYIEGIPIIKYTNQITGKPWKIIATLVYQLADALAYIHSCGYLHRDIKSSNILVRPNGEPILLDFGLAKVKNDPTRNLTMVNEILGSVNMSPEQAEGKNDLVDERSDIYSLGTIFYEMLTKQFVFPSANTTLDVLRHIIKTEPILPRDINPRIPEMLEEIVVKCLQKKQQKRYKNAKVLCSKLKQFLDGTGKVSKKYKQMIWYKKNEKIVQHGIIISIIFILTLSILFLFSRPTSYDNTIHESKVDPIQEKIPENILETVYDNEKEMAFFRSEIYQAGFVLKSKYIYYCNGIQNEMEEYIHNATGMEFILLPGGEYVMGGEPFWQDGNKYEKSSPPVKIHISPFLMGKYECSQKIWQKVMGRQHQESYPDHPIVNITWKECQDFCKKTNFCLPSEAQWEYACRSKSSTQYYFGNDDYLLKDYAWYNQNSQTLNIIGKKKPNAFGLYDMIGNVMEWCEDDYFENHQQHPKTELPRITTYNNAPKSIRGSHYKSSYQLSRIEIRESGEENYSNFNIGVRFVYLPKKNQDNWKYLQNKRKQYPASPQTLSSTQKTNTENQTAETVYEKRDPHYASVYLPGLTYLGQKTYTCGDLQNTVEEYCHNESNMIFVLIPDGKFHIGNHDTRTKVHERYLSATPIRLLNIESFLMAKYECSQENWVRIMKTVPWAALYGNRKFTAQQIERLHSTIPATCLRWEDCQTFCKKTGFSLPSEALWEYACRAGSTMNYCFGNSIEHLSKYAICKEDATVEKRLTNSNTMPKIGQKLPNAFGLYDMHGGIWEWCEDDYYLDYSRISSNGDAFITPENTGFKIIRSGSKFDALEYCSSAHRFLEKYEKTDITQGVRFCILLGEAKKRREQQKNKFSTKTEKTTDSIKSDNTKSSRKI
ncbi:MAG TPA: bifunctional serine/threonine-protein kinase/formylglycine-generating enzyme family protein [Planctomycetota bacterium]|nr:bifunctional serine/threonine-protein kinase/formylglycine-generating enzyme family protein [Planctomycetota bacterium]